MLAQAAMKLPLPCLLHSRIWKVQRVAIVFTTLAQTSPHWSHIIPTFVSWVVVSDHMGVFRLEPRSCWPRK